jgi:hypothetical protein
VLRLPVEPAPNELTSSVREAKSEKSATTGLMHCRKTGAAIDASEQRPAGWGDLCNPIKTDETSFIDLFAGYLNLPELIFLR